MSISLSAQTHALSEKEALDYPAYQSWYALRAQLAEGNHTWFDVDSTQKAALQTLADTANHHAPMLWANHALRLIGEESHYRELVYLPNPSTNKTNRASLADNKETQELVRVYPNPSSDVLNIVANGVVKGQVTLFDLTGELLLQQELNYGTAVLNVKRLTPGMYLVRIYADENEQIAEVKIVIASK